MTAKEYLLQYRRLMAQLRIIEANINWVREERLTLNPSWPDGQPHGTQTSDPTSQKVLELIRLLDKYEHDQTALRAKCYRKRMRIDETISHVEDPDCRTLLHSRYIEMLTWEEIAVNMGYTYQWVAGPLHGKALKIIGDIIKKDEPLDRS